MSNITKRLHVITKVCVRCGINYILNEVSIEFHKTCKRTYVANWKRYKYNICNKGRYDKINQEKVV